LKKRYKERKLALDQSGTKKIPVQGLNQMMDEHHSLFFVHKHKKDHGQATLLILPQPQL
jgi:hypothetical protein